VASKGLYMQHKSGLDLDDYLPYLLNRVGRAAVEIFTADALAAEDLTIDMWRALAALSHDGAQRQVDLSARTSIEASSLSRVAARLEGMGLVVRQRSKTSSREVMVALSPKGSALVARLIPIAHKLEAAAVKGIPAKDVQVLKRTLRLVFENLAANGSWPR
jgi:DNA-binding MarR family transcriptional regulator